MSAYIEIETETWRPRNTELTNDMLNQIIHNSYIKIVCHTCETERQFKSSI